MKKQATDTQDLIARIKSNGAQELNFMDWVFSGLSINPDAKIVELCSGSGMQTARLAGLLGAGGRVWACDINSSSLEKMSSGLASNLNQKVEKVCVDFNERNKLLGLLPAKFDLCFCSYGLYYNHDVPGLLNDVKPRLSDHGQIIVVGPFGDNNGELFSFLELCGVRIDAYVKFTCQPFMNEVLLKWATSNYKQIQIDTIKNQVRWQNSDTVLRFWRSSTFYDEKYDSAVSEKLKEWFKKHDTFVNTKWIMRVVIQNAL